MSYLIEAQVAGELRGWQHHQGYLPLSDMLQSAMTVAPYPFVARSRRPQQKQKLSGATTNAFTTCFGGLRAGCL